MDNLTHTLVGVAVANAGFTKRYGRGAAWILAIASNLPDVDALWAILKHGDAFLSRRMLTHSLPGIFLIALLFSRLWRWRFKDIDPGPAFGLSLLGLVLHVFFDLVNSYGVVLFYPFSRVRFELAWIFIIDLAIWVILLVPMVLPFLPGKGGARERWAQVSVVALVVYVAFCGLSHALAQRALADVVERDGTAPDMTTVFPEALGAHRFRGVIKKGPDYDIHLIHSLGGRTELKETVATNENSPEVRRARETPEGRRLEWFFKAPVWKVTPGPEGTLVHVFDLRFRSMVIARQVPFVFSFLVTPETVTYLGRRR